MEISRPESYTPLSSATTQESPDSFDYPLTNIRSMYSRASGHSASSTFKLLRKPVPSTSSLPALLREEDYFQEKTSSYEKITDEDGKSQPQEFRYWRQFRDLLLHGFLRFLITVILIVALYEVIWSYNSYPLLRTDQKRVFNFLVTAFSLALGLNLASSLKSIAVKARWWILSWRKRPLDEVEYILGCHSLTKVIVLGYKSIHKNPSITISCALWLLVNLASQAFVVVLGLNWSIEAGAIDLSHHIAGDVFSSNMTQFSFTYFGGNTPGAEQITAHLYGELVVSYATSSSTSDTPDHIQAIPALTQYFQSKSIDLWDFETYSQYIFVDLPVANNSVMGQFYTNRSVISQSRCQASVGSAIIAQDKTASANVSGIIWDSMPPNSTTYMVNSTNDGPLAGCGNRCATIFALEIYGTSAYLYTCNVTIGNVTNTTVPGQQISSTMARMAAESIALNGFGNPYNSYQSQSYDSGFFYGTPLYGDTSAMERILRLNALSAIAGADKNNPWLDPLPGQVLDQGNRLTLDHPEYIEAILGGIGGFHFLIFILAAYLANKVVVIQDNYLAISLLLHPVVEKLKERGISVSGKGIAIKDLEVAYGSVSKSTGTGSIRHLEISEASEKPSEGWMGWYA